MPPPPQPGAESPTLEVQHLTVRLEGRVILDDLSFDVAAGSLVAVIGPNGSGKTVLARTLIGAIPHTGIVRWAAGTRVGYVPQKVDIERTLPVTGRDLLVARSRISHVTSEEIAAAVARVGLTDDAVDRLVGAMSGGQLQRVLIAAALLGRPTVLLLDEPTTGVDQPGQQRLSETLQQLQRDGVTLIMISHDLSVVSRLATDVLCLTRDHRCLEMPRRVLRPEILADVYGEPVGFFRHDEPVG